VDMYIMIRCLGLEWQMCKFWLGDLIQMTYLTIYQIEHLVKLNKKFTILIKMANEFQSIGTFGQVEQSKMTSLIKMDNIVLIKLVILCYIIGNVSYKLN
jgi:hypothetical protein